MQVSSTLIAAQQAAREAAARLQVPRPGFAAALDQVAGSTGGFEPLPLKQTAAPAPQPSPPGPVSRPGAQLDITI